MRILVVSNMYPSDLAPSYGTFVESFVGSVRKIGIQVDLSVIEFPYSGVRKIISYLLFILCTTRKIYLEKYDCIYVHYGLHSALPLLFAPRLNCRVVINFHGTDVCGNSFRARCLRRVLRKTIYASDLIVVPSGFLKDVVIDRLKVSPAKLRVLPSAGINSSIFFPKPSCSRFRPKGFEIGYVGRLIPEKGVDILLRSVFELNLAGPPVISLVRVVGVGSDLERLKKITLSYKMDHYVCFEGACARENIGAIYRNIDILVVPSRLPESLGLVVIEALACGTPVVVSDSGALKHLIQEGRNGAVFESGNHASCIEAILLVSTMLRDDPEGVRMRTVESVSSFREEYLEREIFDVLKPC